MIHKIGIKIKENIQLAQIWQKKTQLIKEWSYCINDGVTI
jgi:hypothetical protein